MRLTAPTWPRPDRSVARLAIMLLAGLTPLTVGRGEDRVTFLDAQQRLVTRTGEIVLYDQRELRLRLPQGTTHRISASRVVSVQADRSPEHEQADHAFESGDDAAALPLYRAAYRVESRRWVQHQIVARSVACLRHLDQVGHAATTFLALLQQDPQTPWSGVIPLAWRAERPDRILEDKADGWLAADQPAAARLIAASWLLSGRQRDAAQRALQDVVRREPDSWIGQVAASQLWRVRLVTADQDEVRRWQSTMDRMPANQQAGPSFVIAQALARHDDVDAAVLAYLQVAWVHEADRELASESLWAAAQLLDEAEHPAEARRIYRELATRFPQSPLAVEAERMVRQ